MPLDSLASVDDVAALLAMQSVGIDDDQAEALLAQASARFRREALTDFTEAETTLVLRVDGNRIGLPKRPVTSVDLISQVNDDGSEGAAVVGWSFDGIHTVRVCAQDFVINSGNFENDPETVYVTWHHGHGEVPEDVRWAVAQMVARAVNGPSPGLESLTAGAYSETQADGGESGAAYMTEEEKMTARAYRPPSPNATSVQT